MKIASWNVNSVKARLPHLLAFLEDAQPDVLVPAGNQVSGARFSDARSQGRWAITSRRSGSAPITASRCCRKRPADELVTGLPGNDEDEQPRYIEASFGEVRVASVYLPNGNPVGTDKFTYKLAWMERLVDHTRELLQARDPVRAGRGL